MHRSVDGQALYNFLTQWRERLVAIRFERLMPEEFGQILALNTVLCWIDDEAAQRHDAAEAPRCDHKLVDSTRCVKCGWTPPPAAPANTTITKGA